MLPVSLPRIKLLGLCGVFLLAVIPLPAHGGAPFGYKDVVEKAKVLAEKSFEEPEKIPDFLLRLSYDQWREIRFKPEKALWVDKKLPFHVQFFLPGFLYNRKVTIDVVGPAGVEEVPFSSDLFHYGTNNFKGKIPAHLGFAGFRPHYQLNTKGHYDEFALFLGASYFRTIGGRTSHYSINDGNCSPEGNPVSTAMPLPDRPKTLFFPTARK